MPTDEMPLTTKASPLYLPAEMTLRVRVTEHGATPWRTRRCNRGHALSQGHSSLYMIV
jgi:hypothetical protein